MSKSWQTQRAEARCARYRSLAREYRDLRRRSLSRPWPSEERHRLILRAGVVRVALVSHGLPV